MGHASQGEPQARPARRRVTGSALNDLGLVMAAVGLAIGVSFPWAMAVLGVPGRVAYAGNFRAACVVAGLVLALCNWLLARRVIGRRTAVLTGALLRVAAGLRDAGAGRSLTLVEPPARLAVDSADELGAAYGAVNELVDALAVAHRYQSLVQATSDVITLVHEDGVIRFSSPSLRSVLGYDPARITDQQVRDLVHPADAVRVEAFLTGLVDGAAPAPIVTRIRHRDGRWRAVETAGVNSLHVPELRALVLTSRDITERQELADELSHQALHDALTGLPNRTLLADRFGQALRTAERTGTSTGLLLIDLDRFKEINDTFGHHYGDELLRQIGPRLSVVLREADTVARLGGDEFAVLLPDVRSVDNAVAVELRDALEMPFRVENVELDVEASIGVVTSGEHGLDATTLLQHADIAMYVAKTQNLGVSAYDPAADRHSPAKLALLGDLRRALDRGELILHYQPKVSISTGDVVGAEAEALVRWQHPEHGLLSPDAFVPLAEHTGLIGPLTRHVLATALAQARTWAEAGRPVMVSVNLSARNLLDEDLPGQVASLLVTHGVPATLLELEVTESAIMTEPTRARRLLEQLSALGVRISIDDFGAGYTSLGQLKTLPVAELKIDKSFVLTMTEDSSSGLIVRSVVELGHNLGLTLVAEGVETGEALTALAGYGCDVAQGYHLCRPVDAAAFDTWCAERRTAGPYPAGTLTS